MFLFYKTLGLFVNNDEYHVVEFVGYYTVCRGNFFDIHLDLIAEEGNILYWDQY